MWRRVGRWAWWGGLAVAGLVFLVVWFGPAAQKAYIHYARTEVTVTLTSDCWGPDTPVPRLACHAEWTVDGEEHEGWVLGRLTGDKGEVFDGAVVTDEYVYQDFGLSAVDRAAFVGGAALLAVVPAGMFARRWRAARRGRQFPMMTVVLSPVVTLGVLGVAGGLAVLAPMLDLPDPDPGQSGHGLLAVGAGVVLMLAVIPSWRPILRRARERDDARIAKLRERAAADRAARAATSPEPSTVPAGPPRPPRLWWNDPALTSMIITDTLRLAAGGLAPGTAITTGRLLDAVARMDVGGDWQRVWLVVGDPHRLGVPAAPDSTDPAPGPVPDDGSRVWAGIPLTARLTQSLWLADRIAGAYGLRPMPTGVVALALLAHRGNGAADALLAGGAATHRQLLAAVQSDVLRVTLPGLSRYIPNA